MAQLSFPREHLQNAVCSGKGLGCSLSGSVKLDMPRERCSRPNLSELLV